MNIGIIGAGVAGLTAAHLLSEKHNVTLIEKQKRIGGHTNTITVEENGEKIGVDTGFIVLNDRNYTNFKKLLEKLDVKTFCNQGDVLDPNLHDALMIRHEKDKHENEILEVFEKGYLYKDRVIRHAKVVVNQTPS